MDNRNDKTQQLLKRYLDGTLSKKEFHEFLSLLAGIDKSRLSQELLTLWEASRSPEFSLPEEEWDKKMKQLTEETENFHFKNRKKIYGDGMQRPFSWGKVAAAVFIFAIAGGTFWFLSSRQDNNSGLFAFLNHPEYDIQPGGNRAVLTLGDGSRIVLDSLQNGTIAKQGNVEIVKLDDGRLAYDVSGDEKSNILNNKIITPRGGQYYVKLPDGTKVWLNSASSIDFPAIFTGKERKVEITGEVYFEVAHDANLPFVVKAGDAQIKVLGTHFNVNAYEDEDAVKVTLLEGQVKVSSSPENSVSLSPGQQVSLSKTGDMDVAKVDPSAAITWKNGYFQFDHADIQTVMRQLARWYDVEIVYGKAIPKQLFGGEMQRNLTLSQVLNILGKSQVRFRIEDRKIIVMN
jgi:ferric-dicitrate binding protein FerR (iron transport regulator)